MMAADGTAVVDADESWGLCEKEACSDREPHLTLCATLYTCILDERLYRNDLGPRPAAIGALVEELHRLTTVPYVSVRHVVRAYLWRPCWTC